jgi:hypothetical protein
MLDSNVNHRSTHGPDTKMGNYGIQIERSRTPQSYDI